MITTTEAAALLGISTTRMCLLLRDGRVIGAVKQGRNWRIPLYNGQVKIENKGKGPDGSWTQQKPPCKTLIHINIHVIESNLKNGASEPVMSVQQEDKQQVYTNYVEVSGKCRIFYEPDASLDSGGQLWIENYGDVIAPTL